MKLYSKEQFVFGILMTALGCLILATASFTLIFVHLKKSPAKTASTTTFENNLPAAQNVNVPAMQQSASYTVDELQNINVYNSCNDAVVNINTQVQTLAFDYFLDPIPITRDGGSGSGSIIDKRGYVLTNIHVVRGATKIYVSLSDGTRHEASIVGFDENTDLAVIKFKPPAESELTTIAFGDSSMLKVGQKVIAIGNPFGFARTMTVGIVSALGRPIKNSQERIIRNMIQTDTAINPGNSGGPLLDANGRMIGINTMIYSNSGSSIGIGFAVPSATAARVVSDLLKYGKVRRGTIDANFVQLTTDIAKYDKLDIARGLLVSQTAPGGIAERAGLVAGSRPARYNKKIIYLGGDVITKIDGIDIAGLADYYSALEDKKVGDSVTLTVHRDKKDRVLTLTLVADGSDN